MVMQVVEVLVRPDGQYDQWLPMIVTGHSAGGILRGHYFPDGPYPPVYVTGIRPFDLDVPSNGTWRPKDPAAGAELEPKPEQVTGHAGAVEGTISNGDNGAVIPDQEGVDE